MLTLTMYILVYLRILILEWRPPIRTQQCRQVIGHAPKEQHAMRSVWVCCVSNDGELIDPVVAREGLRRFEKWWPTVCSWALPMIAIYAEGIDDSILKIYLINLRVFIYFLCFIITLILLGVLVEMCCSCSSDTH